MNLIFKKELRNRDFDSHWGGKAGAAPGATRPMLHSRNAQRNYEKYLTLARAEAQIGNAIGAENYYQYAGHYFRLMHLDPEPR
jgi:hypothetical protein